VLQLSLDGQAAGRSRWRGWLARTGWRGPAWSAVMAALW
jgi:hypothetical protein